MGFPFFIQTSSRISIFKEVHEIVFHGKGGYDWGTVYNMPVWLRRYTYNEISQFYQKEREEFEKSLGKEQVTGNTDPSKFMNSVPSKVNVPDFVSSVKRPKK